MQAVEERVCDQPVLKLLRAMLRAGVMEDGQVRRPDTGAAQGGVISPVMCNVYLHRLDRAWDDGDGVLVRFADDLVVMCWSRSQAEAALARLTDLLAGLGLEPKAAKTRIVHLEEGGGGFDFLGFHHRMVRSRGLHGKKPALFLARWPSDKAMQQARKNIYPRFAQSISLNYKVATSSLSASQFLVNPVTLRVKSSQTVPIEEVKISILSSGDHQMVNHLTAVRNIQYQMSPRIKVSIVDGKGELVTWCEIVGNFKVRS